MAGERKNAYPPSTFQVTLGGPETAGLFSEVSGFISNIDHSPFHHVDAQGAPAEAKTPGACSLSDVTFTRGLDKDMAMWKWHNDCCEKGPEDARKTVIVKLLDSKLGTVTTWTLHEAWPCTYQASGMQAHNSAAATEMIGFTFERMERT
jgi:phage tail-like protein